ncbi:MAG: heavy metal translocating P-type ATPase metal-binding domain-containing protein [Bacteroidota bacterium]
MNATAPDHIPTVPPPAAECYHCGDPAEERFHHDGKYFCCRGCQSVYLILSEHGLDHFYTLNRAAGQHLKAQPRDRYAFLDQVAVRDQLIDYADDERVRVRFHLPQIHCSSCLWLLENLYRLEAGIRQSRVNFPRKEVHITFDPQVTTLRRVVEQLAQIGYAPPLRLQDLEDHTAPRAVDRSLYAQLGLAGFVFGNVMLLSFPEYLGLDALREASFARFLGYLNLLLILPAIRYSGQHYWRSAWGGLRQGQLNIDVPISLGILALFGRSAFEILSHTGPGYLDSLAGLLFFLLVGRWFQQQTFHQITFDRNYKSYFPIASTRLEATGEQAIPLDQIRVGDRLLLRHGELIPADAILRAGEALMDYSFVTGESLPQRQTVGQKLYAGGRQMGGRIEVEIKRTVSQSYLTQLWNEEAFQDQPPTGRVSAIADRVARYFTLAILSIAALTLGYWLCHAPNIAWQAATAVLIIACPCAVALSIPFTLGNVLRILGRRGFYLKNTQALENLARINHIVFDKTGTLTEVQAGALHYRGRPLSPEQRAWVSGLARQSGHPLSRQLAANLAVEPAPEIQHFEEHQGRGTRATVAGHQLRLGAPHFIGLPDTAQSTAGVHLSIDGQYWGSFYQEPRYRRGLAAVLAQLARVARLSLLSGDRDRERDRLAPYFEEGRALFFEQSPRDKLRAIKDWQASGQLMMIGDGLNDAGALQQSDFGLVITENTANFTPACEAVLDASRWTELPRIMHFARRSIRLVYAAYGIAFCYNVIGLSFAVQGLLSPVIAAILMPLSSVSIVLFGIIGTELLARRMGLGRGND